MSDDDIVARLRAFDTGIVPLDVLEAAANEIERLRAEVGRLRDGIHEAHLVLKLTYEEMGK